MPGFNRKGPEGEGPKTGRGLGKCNPDVKDVRTSDEENSDFGQRRGFRGQMGGVGGRCGNGRGQGRGRGRRLGWS